MNRTQKFSLNTTMAALTQIVALIVGLITPRLMIATYGSEVNGLVSSLNQLITYISLVEAGIGGAAIYSLYKPLAEKDHGRISRIVTAARKSYAQAGYLFSGALFIMAVAYGVLRSTETLTFGVIFPLALILGVHGVLNFFLTSGYRTLVTADQRNYVLSINSITQAILRTVIICCMAAFKLNVILLYAFAVIPNFLTAGMLLYYCRKNYPYIDRKATPDKSALGKRWDVIYQQILGTLQMGAPTVIATVLLDLKTVSVYAVYNMVLAGINGILNIFRSGLPAGFGDLIARGERAALQKSTAQFEVAFNYLLSVVFGLTMVMILPFITLYTAGLTDTNYYQPVLAVTIVLNGLLYSIKTPQSMLIISAGMYKETRWRVTIQAVIIILCGVGLGIPFELPGIMIGTCLSNLYRVIDLLHFVPKYITHLNPWTSVWRQLRVVLNVALIWLPTLVIPVNAGNYLWWVLYAMGYGIYALAVVTLTTWLFDRQDFYGLLHRVRGMLRRR